ncbi:hypothetical protein [Rhodococcus opacus]|uniref:hypothetical protein n=1 Tax=Rhodococcus opacus TaxID=37919 RepID=UPI0022B50873|nr:hypothetical protein [Rhodococcus opacus]
MRPARTELATFLADKTRECTELSHRLDAAATAMAALHHDNTLLPKNSTTAVNSSHSLLTAATRDGGFPSDRRCLTSQSSQRSHHRHGHPGDQSQLQNPYVS